MLKKCKECGDMISDKATSCSKCGYKTVRVGNRKSGCLWVLVLITGFLVFSVFSDRRNEEEKILQAKINSHVVNKDIEKKFAGLIQDFIKTGVFYKVEKFGDVPHVYIGKIFKQVGIDEKSNALKVAFIYFKNLDPRVKVMSIYDGYSGEHIGRFSESGFDVD
ncbi:MAG: hypothetical protein M0R47_16975 [Methylobacter sp.]|uniref:hypothetical protein n=1 Tax=Methylobacter sp. TaxID=2051955 RepID=UPI0025D6B9F9|nr:hypothetical protein [Methylobacter sp.]MCK9622217.1 hypothetical protein [Methylobacter sp.]